MEKVSSLTILDRWYFSWAKKSQRFELTCYYDKDGADTKIQIYSPSQEAGLAQIEKMVCHKV